MKNDVRDEALGRLLDGVASKIEATPRIQPVVRRGSLKRGARTTAMVAAVAVFVGTVGYGALQMRRTAQPVWDPSTWNTHRNPDGWTASYPDGWHVQSFSQPVGHVSLSGAFFSNVAHDFHHPDLGPNEATSAWDLSSFPPDGVAVSLERFVGGRFFGPGHPDTPFPLSIEDASIVEGSAPAVVEHRTIEPVFHGGLQYTLNVWFGPDASQQDREIAGAIVSTVGFSDASPAPPITRVPDLSGLTVAEAETALNELGLGSIHVYLASDTIAQGTVSETTPEPGTKVHVGTSVELYVSAGPASRDAGFGWIERVFASDPGALIGMYRGPDGQGMAAISRGEDLEFWRSRLRNASDGRSFTVVGCPTTWSELEAVTDELLRLVNSGEPSGLVAGFAVEPRACSVLVEGTFTPETIDLLRSLFGDEVTLVDGVEPAVVLAGDS